MVCSKLYDTMCRVDGMYAVCCVDGVCKLYGTVCRVDGV